ncbi:MAG: VOC family protein [Chitinophagales bacterium]|nr:VOC family protein [Chitinophagales bacterium]
MQESGKQKDWYQKHLGIKAESWGSSIFWWRDFDNSEKKCSTSWSTFKSDTKYFSPSKKEFMFNFRVKDLIELLKMLKEEGIEQAGEMEIYNYGKFA